MYKMWSKIDAYLPSNKTAEWVGAIFGVLGSILISLNTDISRYAWYAYLISNFSWFLFGVRIKSKGMIFMQVIFAFISCFGLYRWIFSI